MNKLKIENVILSECDNEITLEFLTGKVYLIHSRNTNQEMFEFISLLKTPINGNIFLNEININCFNSSVYRQNLVTIIDESNSFIKNIKVMKYLKMVTNNFRNTKSSELEFVDNAELIYNLLKKFGFNKTIFNKRIKDLNEVEKWQLKIVESLLKRTKILIVYKTLDFYDDEMSNFCIDSLQNMVEKHNQCVLIFSNKQNLLNKIDNSINI